MKYSGGSGEEEEDCNECYYHTGGWLNHCFSLLLLLLSNKINIRKENYCLLFFLYERVREKRVRDDYYACVVKKRERIIFINYYIKRLIKFFFPRKFIVLRCLKKVENVWGRAYA